MDDQSQINVLRTVIKMIKQTRKLKDDLEAVRRENQEREDGVYFSVCNPFKTIRIEAD